MEDDRLLSLAVAVASERNLQDVLQTIVRGLASQPGVALARIWLLLPGDICDSCFLRDHCLNRTRCLHLVASAGTALNSPGEDWSRLDGRFRRLPLNSFIVGVVGATGTATLIQDVAEQSLHLERPEGSARNVLAGDIAEVAVHGERARVRIRSAPPITAEVTTGSVERLGLREDLAVFASCKAVEVQVRVDAPEPDTLGT